MLTDILIANRSDADAIAKAANPSAQWSGVDAKGIDLVKMAGLSDILLDCGYDAAFSVLVDTLVGPDDGPGFVRCLLNSLLTLLL